MPNTISDLDLLIAAAKAANIRHIAYTNGYDGRCGLAMCTPTGALTVMWNPLNSDGDALRLAVLLGMSLSINLDHSGCIADFVSEVGEDINAATRRAIVRAAAERSMGDSTVSN